MISVIVNKYTSKKMTKDILWNMLSLGILAVGGLLTNFLIGLYYSPSTLGVFNQVFAIYIMFSQVGVWGVHYSVAKYIPEHIDEKSLVTQINSSAVILVTVMGTIASIMTALFAMILGDIFWSDMVVHGIIYVSIAILFFSLNKLLLSILNGYRRMFEYALFQSLRYFLMLLFITIFIFFRIPEMFITGILTCTELVLLVSLLIYCFNNQLFGTVNKNWIIKHFVFGSKVILGGIVAEFNTRVDVLFLGLFYNDYIVGIYSFALIFAEGFYQIYIVVRKNINPILTQVIYKNDHAMFYNIKKLIIKYVYLFMILLGFIIISVYPLLCRYSDKSDYYKGWGVLIILLISMIINSSFIIFGDTLAQSGYPGWQTIVNVVTVGTNILLNAILIPLYGMFGAAIATGLSYVSNSICLKCVIKNKLSLNL